LLHQFQLPYQEEFCIFLGFSKILVGTGKTLNVTTDDIEVIDLESSSTTCTNLPAFPSQIRGGIGGLQGEEPLICGGFDSGLGNYTNKCYLLRNGSWIQTYPLSESKAFMAISPSPFINESNLFFLSGGTNQVLLGTSEVLTTNGWEVVHPDLPVMLDAHCMVLLNETTIFVIGGNNLETRYSNETYFLDSVTGVWSAGPRLNIGRHDHSCGRIRIESGSLEKSVIVVGGFEGNFSSSVEVLNVKTLTWEFGPELKNSYEKNVFYKNMRSIVRILSFRSKVFTSYD